jgi:hypothetical protein
VQNMSHTACQSWFEHLDVQKCLRQRGILHRNTVDIDRFEGPGSG